MSEVDWTILCLKLIGLYYVWSGLDYTMYEVDLTILCLKLIGLYYV